MDINKKIAEELEIKVWQVEAVVKLVDEGNNDSFYRPLPKRTAWGLE